MSAREAFVAQARERVLVFDGAFGTQIQSRRLGEADYAGGVRDFHFYTLNRAEMTQALCHLLGRRVPAPLEQAA